MHRHLPGGVDSPRGNLLDVLQKLGLGRAGVAAEEDVDVASDFVFVLKKGRNFNRKVSLGVRLLRAANSCQPNLIAHPPWAALK